ncbi:MAG TPA: histidine phosphatase family protein [Nakamurella sp.]|nr:histidine phosphatase family protein [Nakamurella sp.]
MTMVPGAVAAGDGQAARPEPRSWVTTVILLRHGRSTANTSGVLAGRTPGINLDDTGQSQATGIADRLSDVAIDRIVSSPLERCRQTLAPLARAKGLTVDVDDRFAEVDYGDWAGRPLRELATESLWRTVQHHASATVFPGGESLAGVSARAVEAVRALMVPPEDPSVQSDGPDAAGGEAPDAAPQGPIARTVLICSHGDVIKALLADALGLHLDSFQRIVVAPASLSVIRYTPLRPFVERINDTGELRSLGPHPVPRLHRADPPPEDPQPVAASEAVPGGVTS